MAPPSSGRGLAASLPASNRRSLEGGRDNDNDDGIEGVQVRIALSLAPDCTDRSLEIPTEPLAVPSSLTHAGLSSVVNHLLRAEGAGKRSRKSGDADEEEDDASDAADTDVLFEFVLHANDCSVSNAPRLLRGSVEAQARRLGWSLEEAVPVTYFPARRYEPLTDDDGDPQPALPDWISCLQYLPDQSIPQSQSLLLSGCYDGSFSVTTMTAKSGLATRSLEVTVPAVAGGGRAGPIKCLTAWPPSSSHDALLVATGSLDHSLSIHRLDRSQATIVAPGTHPPAWDAALAARCGGHDSSVEALDVTADGAWLASGGFDGTLCLWNVRNAAFREVVHSDLETTKRSKVASGSARPSTSATTVPTLTPKASLRAHAAAISGLSWGNHHHNHRTDPASGDLPSLSDRLVTGSWDHSLRLWDVERQEALVTLNGSRVVTSLDTSYHAPGIVASSHPDCAIRCWDVRVPGGNTGAMSASTAAATLNITGTAFRPSHRAWVSAVVWDPDSPYHLLSGSHDGTVKFWDLRSPLALQTVPVVDRSTGEDHKTLAVTLGANGHGFAAGTEGRLQAFRRVHREQ